MNHKQTRLDYKETLIQKLAAARENSQTITADSQYSQYWKGVTDTIQNTLNDLYTGWAEYGTTGYWVWTQNQSYVSAIASLKSVAKEAGEVEKENLKK